MKKALAACAVLSLTFASPALAHEPVASAEQVCVEDQIVLSGTFDNPGFETTVTITDSQDGNLATDLPAPANFSTNFNGPARAAGTVTYEWTADKHSGTLTADYEAVEGCEQPPPPPPEKPPIPPDQPPRDIEFPGEPNDNPPPPGSPNQPPVDQANPETLPLTGVPLVPLALIGAGLVGAGFSLRRLRG